LSNFYLDVAKDRLYVGYGFYPIFFSHLIFILLEPQLIHYHWMILIHNFDDVISVFLSEAGLASQGKAVRLSSQHICSTLLGSLPRLCLT
jgi:hypothetical protein